MDQQTPMENQTKIEFQNNYQICENFSNRIQDFQNERSTNKYHKKVIILRPMSSFNIIGVKKIKLNSELAYICVQSPRVSLGKKQIQEEEELIKQQLFSVQKESNQFKGNLQQFLQARKKVSKKECSYRNELLFSPHFYESLKTVLSQNNPIPFNVNGDEQIESIQKFMKLYEPKQFLINFKTTIKEKQLQQFAMKGIEKRNNALLYPYFSFRDSVLDIKYNEMKDENMLKVKKALKNIFYLYLNGDYRGINDSNTGLNNAESDNWGTTISNRYVSYKYKSKHINFDYSNPKKGEDISNFDSPNGKENEEENLEEGTKAENTANCAGSQSQIENNKKQVIYNKSKYVMQFILRLLDQDHLNFLTIPEGFTSKIESIQKNIRGISKRNKLSQSQFYNHTHFDCLFLQINKNNEQYLHNNLELQQMHLGVFEMTDLDDIFTINTINFYKELISQIILLQVDLIRNSIIPQLAVHTLSFKSSSKLKYFERICDSIEKLKEGNIISKF